MKALILGAGGQVGRALAAAAPEGAETVALGRSDCDVADPAALRSAEGQRRPQDPVRPEGVYARTKLEGEGAALAADPNALIVRTAWVYAPVGPIS